jgi:hypothetical protein
MAWTGGTSRPMICSEVPPAKCLFIGGQWGIRRAPKPRRYVTLDPMIRQIAPQFFTMNILATVAYYKDKLGFECLGTWQDPPVYAIWHATSTRFTFAAQHRPPPTRTNTRFLTTGLLVQP